MSFQDILCQCGVSEGDTVQFDFEEDSIEVQIREERANRRPED